MTFNPGHVAREPATFDMDAAWGAERDRQARASQERRAAELEALRTGVKRAAVRHGSDAMPAGHPVSWGAISRGPWTGEGGRMR